MKTLPELITGDHLLYSASDIFGQIVRLKTWSNAVHIEIYVGEGLSIASRSNDIRGVSMYPTRYTNLAYILRPKEKGPLFEHKFEVAMKWFSDKAIGQKYDWLGLLCFTLAVKQGSPNKMFCSELAARFDKHAQIEAFNHIFDCDKIAPANFLMSPSFLTIYENNHA